MKKKTGVSVILTLLGIIMLFPIYILFMTSFKGSTEIFEVTLFPSAPTLDSIKAVWNGSLLRSLLNSFIVATTITVVAMVLHAMCGYALARYSFPGKKLIFIVIISTLMIPMTTILVPLFMICKALRITNSYGGLIIPALFNAYGIFLFRQFYMDFPVELEEASQVDGCSRVRFFFSMVLPLSRPMIIPLIIAFFLGNWNNYLWPMIVNRKEELETVQVYLANKISGYSTPWNEVIATAALAAIPVFLLFMALQKQLQDGIKISGIK